ncbi:MAG: Fic family protein [Myxococcales bacterium]|nr:Fic family protein [Myxococcales bacterium]
MEDRVSRLQEVMGRARADVRKQFEERFELSWIYHDGVLEGQVYTPEELNMAFSDKVVNDASLLPTYDEIRNMRAAIALIRDLADKKKANVTQDVIKKIYLTLSPEEAEQKGAPTFRKEMPLHRLYFHDIATPEKIAPKMKQLMDWASSAETKRSIHTVRLAAKVHHEFLLVYPFTKHSGRVARLLMNMILLRQGYPPAIIHATERQRYYEALKTSSDATAQIVGEALAASVESTIQFFEKRGRAA